MTSNKEVGATEHIGKKYLLVEINERNGEKECTFKCLAQCSTEQNNDLVADAIALNWYEEDLDAPNDDGLFGFEGGTIAVEVGKIHQLPQEHYEVLSLYLSDLTHCDRAITEAITYLTPAKSQNCPNCALN